MDLEKIYGDGTRAVKNTSFAIKKGQILGLLGPNGSGKSSIFNMLTMKIRKTGGEIQLMDLPIACNEIR